MQYQIYINKSTEDNICYLCLCNYVFILNIVCYLYKNKAESYSYNLNKFQKKNYHNFKI